MLLVSVCHRRAFSPGAAKEHRLVLEQKRKPDLTGYFYLLNGARYEDGYLVRTYALKNLSLEEGLPPLEDLQRFNQARAGGRTDAGCLCHAEYSTCWHCASVADKMSCPSRWTAHLFRARS